jgi:hypothetical protein
MPYDKIDLGEAMIARMLATYPVETVEKANEEMRAGRLRSRQTERRP